MGEKKVMKAVSRAAIEERKRQAGRSLFSFDLNTTEGV